MSVIQQTQSDNYYKYTCNIHTHIPEEHNNNDKSILTTFELIGKEISFVEHLCEFCEAKYINGEKITLIYFCIILLLCMHTLINYNFI